MCTLRDPDHGVIMVPRASGSLASRRYAPLPAGWPPSRAPPASVLPRRLRSPGVCTGQAAGPVRLKELAPKGRFAPGGEAEADADGPGGRTERRSQLTWV